jgi:hypothetical protein
LCNPVAVKAAEELHARRKGLLLNFGQQPAITRSLMQQACCVVWTRARARRTWIEIDERFIEEAQTLCASHERTVNSTSSSVCARHSMRCCVSPSLSLSCTDRAHTMLVNTHFHVAWFPVQQKIIWKVNCTFVVCLRSVVCLHRERRLLSIMALAPRVR